MSGRERLSAATLAIFAGCIFVWFNFNGLIRHFGKQYLSSDSVFLDSVMSISLFPKQLLGSTPEALYLWMVVCFAGIWAYFGAILLLALVHRRAGLAGYGVLGVVGGGFAPALLCWAGLLAWAILKVVGIIFGFIGHILGIVIAFIMKALIFAFPVLIVIALVAVVIWAWRAGGAKPVLFGAAAALVLYLLAPVIKFVVEKIRLMLVWIAEMLAFLFGWLPAVLAWLGHAIVILLGITSIIGFVGCLGQILIDQFKTAADAGKSQKAVFTASFSLGLSMALILLVAAGSPQATIAQGHPTVTVETQQQTTARTSRTAALAKKKKGRKNRKDRKAPITTPAVVVAVPPPPNPMADVAAMIDRAWSQSTFFFENASPTGVFLAILPSAVEEWARQTFRTASAPIFDAVVLALALALSMVGVLRGIFWRSEFEYQMRFYNRDLLMIAVVPLFILGYMINASESNQD